MLLDTKGYVDLARLKELNEQKYVRVQRHPAAPYLIWNYTNNAMWDAYWPPEVRMCRGLITDLDGKILWRSFEKFFNWGEEQHHGPLPREPFEVFEKIDGSMGLLHYLPNGDPAIATRGSFVSEQACWATDFLRENHDFTARQILPRHWSFVFEILYPENRIVVDYGGKKDLVLLAVIDTETGEDVTIPDHAWGFTAAKRYDGLKNFDEIMAAHEDNTEGFVVRFQSGLRLKMKGSQYVRLHKILTRTTPRTIWENLAADVPPERLCRDTPDSFDAWVKEVADGLRTEYARVEETAKREFDEIGDLSDRKSFALEALKRTQPHVLFRLYDGKPYRDLIWKQLKPGADRAFMDADE